MLLVGCGTALAANWPQFRGPDGLGRTDEKNLPLTWNRKTGENIVWKTPIPKADNAYSSPIVWGGRVFVTYAINNPVEHHVLCFDRADGRQLWDTAVPAGQWLLKDLRGGYGAPTPCTDGKAVFVVFGSAVIAALDFDGKIVWRKELEKFHFDVALGSSPVLYGDTVILNCDQDRNASSIIAFSKSTGEIRWEAKRPLIGAAHSTPVFVTVRGGKQMLVSAANAVQGLDPDNGRIIWWCAAQGDASSPAFDGSRTFSDSGRGGRAVCVDANGEGDVTKTHLQWTFPQIPEGLSSAVIVGGRVFRTHNPEVLKCIDLKTGALVFSERLTGVSTWASPFTTPEGNIYFASAGKSYVVKAGEKLDIVATNDLGEESRASVAVSDGQLFIRGNKNLYCIGKKP